MWKLHLTVPFCLSQMSRIVRQRIKQVNFSVWVHCLKPEMDMGRVTHDLSWLIRLPIRPGFPGHVLLFAFVQASGRVFENRRFVRVFGQIRKYIRTLPIAKAYDGMRPRKLVSFQYNMSVTSQNAILVQASCTCLLTMGKICGSGENECFHLCKASGQGKETSCILNPWKEFSSYNTV